jgi:hypothetical protein
MMNNATPWNRLYNLGKPSIASGAAALAMALTALVVPASTVSAQTGGPICAIQTFNGYYLTAQDSGGRTSDVIHTNATQIQAWEKFTLVSLEPGNPFIAWKARDGHYLTAVGGGGRNTDVIHSNETQRRSWEQFGLEYQGNGFYAIRTVNGHYLTAVGDGGYGSELPDTMHSDATRIGNWEKFTLVCSSV